MTAGERVEPLLIEPARVENLQFVNGTGQYAKTKTVRGAVPLRLREAGV